MTTTLTDESKTRAMAPADAAAAVRDANAPEAGQTEGTLQVVSFRLGNEQYGIDIMHVQEIILVGRMTLMPNVPSYVRGLINLRGHVIPIFDLRSRFELDDAEPTGDARIVVLNVGKRTVGVTVDAVEEVQRIREEQIDRTAIAVSGIGHQFVEGLVKFESKLMILLDVEAVADDGEGIAVFDNEGQAV